jgi:hypothetical protein
MKPVIWAALGAVCENCGDVKRGGPYSESADKAVLIMGKHATVYRAHKRGRGGVAPQVSVPARAVSLTLPA